MRRSKTANRWPLLGAALCLGLGATTTAQPAAAAVERPGPPTRIAEQKTRLLGRLLKVSTAVWVGAASPRFKVKAEKQKERLQERVSCMQDAGETILPRMSESIQHLQGRVKAFAEAVERHQNQCLQFDHTLASLGTGGSEARRRPSSAPKTAVLEAMEAQGGAAPSDMEDFHRLAQNIERGRTHLTEELRLINSFFYELLSREHGDLGKLNSIANPSGDGSDVPLSEQVPRTLAAVNGLTPEERRSAQGYLDGTQTRPAQDEAHHLNKLLDDLLVLEREESRLYDALSAARHDLSSPLESNVHLHLRRLEDMLDKAFSRDDASPVAFESLRYRLGVIQDKLELADRFVSDMQAHVTESELTRGQVWLDRVVRIVFSGYHKWPGAQGKRLSVTPLDTTPIPPIDSIPRGLIERLLHNFGRNGIKYTLEGTEVEVLYGLRPKGPRGGPSKLVLQVKDRGPGVPATERKKIFEPWYQSPGSVQGTGQGLAIVTRSVRELGGGVSVRNRRGGGAVFQVVIPVPSESLEEDAKPEKGR